MDKAIKAFCAEFSQFRWRKFFAFVVVIAGAAFLFLFVATRRPGISRGAAVEIRINTKGLPTILGITLGTGPVRDITLGALNWANVPVRVIIPSTPIGPASETDAFRTINAISASGADKIRPSNPYE
jgi:hypothetical protein